MKQTLIVATEIALCFTRCDELPPIAASVRERAPRTLVASGQRSVAAANH